MAQADSRTKKLLPAACHLFVKSRLDTLKPCINSQTQVADLPAGIIVKDAAVLTAGGNVDVTLAVGGFQAKVTEIHGGEG